MSLCVPAVPRARPCACEMTISQPAEPLLLRLPPPCTALFRGFDLRQNAVALLGICVCVSVHLCCVEILWNLVPNRIFLLAHVGAVHLLLHSDFFFTLMH